MNRKFDRLKFFDPRSRKFRVEALDLPRKKRSYTWACNVCLDQGSEGACVGFAWAHEAAARPAVNTVDEGWATEIYLQAQKADEWPGEDYEGTSVLAGAKVSKASGLMTGYHWAFDVDEMIQAVGHMGPAVLGIDWYEGMFSPDSNGFIHPTGALAGGHAILCNGVNLKGEYFRLHNSWGPGWGKKGECLLSFNDMQFLFDKLGECCVPEGRKVVG